MNTSNETLTHTQSTTQSTTAEPPVAAPPAPAVLIAQIRAMREVIPDYTQLPLSSRQSLAAVASTDREFIRASINGVAESSAVEQAVGRTPEDLRQEASAVNNWTDLEDEVRGLLAGLAAANLVRRNRLGEVALTVYAVSRRLVRQQQHANLLPHVEMMKRLNRFGVKKAKAPSPVPVPQPQPHAVLQQES